MVDSSPDGMSNTLSKSARGCSVNVVVVSTWSRSGAAANDRERTAMNETANETAPVILHGEPLP
jgi:hypothetical protein